MLQQANLQRGIGMDGHRDSNCSPVFAKRIGQVIFAATSFMLYLLVILSHSLEELA
jgi:hypothetical protein